MLPRTKNPVAFATTVWVALALCGFLLTRCSAAVKTITVEGQFTQAINIWWWGEEPITELPLDYVVTCTYDDEAEEEALWASDSSYSIFETAAPDGRIIAAFYTEALGWWEVELGGTEVQVWHGAENLKGISFGNLDATVDSGNSSLWYPDYYGIYFSFRVPNSWSGVSVTDDTLAQVPILQNNSTIAYNAYGYLDGYNDPVDPEFEVFLRDNNLTYSVE